MLAGSSRGRARNNGRTAGGLVDYVRTANTETLESQDITQYRVLDATDFGQRRRRDVDDTIIGDDHVVLELEVVHDVRQIDRSHALHAVVADIEQTNSIHRPARQYTAGLSHRHQYGLRPFKLDPAGFGNLAQ